MIVYSHFCKDEKEIFTTWELTITYSPIDDNRRYKNYTYKYIGRSKEVQTNFDPIIGVRKRSFIYREIEFTNNNTFRFGKYCGKKIEEVNDINYTRWYFEQIQDTDHKAFIKNFLWDNWCEFRTNWEGKEYAVTKKTLDKEQKIAEQNREAINKAKAGDKVYLTINSNPDHDGKVNVDNVTYTFPQVTMQSYMGWAYYLPVKNGKAKRIKGKTILANLMEMDGEIFISNWKIVK